VGARVYGLVNQAVEDLVRTRYGDAVWARIRERAGVRTESFLSMSEYPDAVTYDLVRAASEELAQPPEAVLEAFGELWVLYTSKKGYGEMLEMAGSTLPEFLMNLDQLHTRLGVLMPHLQPPSFVCSDVTDHGLTLHYHSKRQGLGPMVVGLVRGLGKMFGNEVTIERLGGRDQGMDHEQFRVSWS
jgi:hypothetical protein